MRFALPIFLYLLPIALILTSAGFWLAARRRSKLLTAFAGAPKKSWANPGFSKTRQRWHIALTLIAIAALLVALARPMLFKLDKETELQGLPMLIALDMSRSMLATDVKPSRFAAATNAIDQFLSETRADRIGMITFAGVAYLNTPMTWDTLALRNVLRYIAPEDIIDPGSSLTAAIERADRYFQSNNIPQRVLILVTDGEDLGGTPVIVARRVNREHGVKICAIGVGTASGARVPATRSGMGTTTNAFGQQVTTRLNEGNLARIANAAGGRFYRMGDNGEGFRQLREEFLAPLSESAAKADLKNYREAYLLPLGIAMACLLARALIGAERFRVQRALPAIWSKPTNDANPA